VRAADANGQSLDTVLRMDRLAPDLLLFMVSGVLAEAQVEEPPEGLHFGVDFERGDKSLRYITVPAPPGKASTVTAPPKRPGDQIDGAKSVTPPMRGKGVMAIAALKERLDMAVRNAGGNTSGEFTSAEFALEMIEGVQAVIFKSV
jgi:hypothetical protein